MNVAGTPFYSVGENQIHQLDDGRFLGGFFQCRQVHFLFFRRKFHVAAFFGAEVLHHFGEFFAALHLPIELSDCFVHGGFRGNHWLDIEAGHELDVVHRKDVGGINHGDGEC